MKAIEGFWETATTKHRITTARSLALLNALLYVLMMTSIKKAIHISGPYTLIVRCIPAFLICKFIMGSKEKGLWPDLADDKNTVLLRMVGALGSLIMTLALKITDL